MIDLQHLGRSDWWKQKCWSASSVDPPNVLSFRASPRLTEAYKLNQWNAPWYFFFCLVHLRWLKLSRCLIALIAGWLNENWIVIKIMFVELRFLGVDPGSLRESIWIQVTYLLCPRVWLHQIKRPWMRLVMLFACVDQVFFIFSGLTWFSWDLCRQPITDVLVIIIFQTSFPVRCVRFEVNDAVVAWMRPWIWAVVVDSKQLCWPTKFEDRKKWRQPVPTQRHLASVVLATILNGIPFEALQFLRCVKWGLLRVSC